MASVVDEMQTENGLRRLGRVLRRGETGAVRLVKEMYVDGERGRLRWSDVTESDTTPNSREGRRRERIEITIIKTYYYFISARKK